MKKFEGYYIKCTNKKSSIAFILSRHISKKEKSSFIQIITDDNSYITNFHYNSYTFKKKPFLVRIDENILSSDGITLKIEKTDLVVNGNLKFGEFTPIKYNAMGAFKFLPLMECKHTIVSMNHAVSGQLLVNGQIYEFNNDRGYLEGDCGRSFPKKYFWTQCNKFDNQENISIFASCAIIPYLGIHFTGSICIINYNGREYRLATYLGGCVKSFTKNRLIIKQGFGNRRKVLEIEVLHAEKNKRKLLAPMQGKMSRFIKETIATAVRYKLTLGASTLFDVISSYAAFEYSVLGDDSVGT